MIRNKEELEEKENTITIILTETQHRDILEMLDATTFIGKFRHRLIDLENALKRGTVNEKTNNNN